MQRFCSSLLALLLVMGIHATRSASAQCPNIASPYGMVLDLDQYQDHYFDEVQALGAGWVRWGVYWSGTETSPGQYNFDWPDYVIPTLASRGIGIYFTMENTPAWATDGAVGTGVPRNTTDWYNFCFTIASRYPQITYWGLWNEPNYSRFWTGTRDQWINTILIPGAAAIRAANPKAMICGPDTSDLTSPNAPGPFIDAVLSQAGSSIEIITHHHYDNSLTTLRNELQTQIKPVFDSHHWTGQFWLTETGWRSSSVGEQGQANDYTGFLNTWFTNDPTYNWINKVFFFFMSEGVAVDTFGILKYDSTLNPPFSRKLAFTAYQNFISAHPPPAPPPCKATAPNPTNQATGVNKTATLSWSAGTGASSHAVYFGATSPGTFRGNQTTTSFNPGTLILGTTYYWRIDEANSAGTPTGDVWSFMTVPPVLPGKAGSPSPADAVTSVRFNAKLSWAAGTNATSHNVYFGTTSPGVARGNQSGLTFDPGVLSPRTTYFWRIDEVGTDATTTGDVWRFTTRNIPGDCDGDGDVDQIDFGLFQVCFSGATPYPSGCANADLNLDGAVNQADFLLFTGCMSGPDQPANPNCAGP